MIYCSAISLVFMCCIPPAHNTRISCIIVYPARANVCGHHSIDDCNICCSPWTLYTTSAGLCHPPSVLLVSSSLISTYQSQFAISPRPACLIRQTYVHTHASSLCCVCGRLWFAVSWSDYRFLAGRTTDPLFFKWVSVSTDKTRYHWHMCAITSKNFGCKQNVS